MNEVAIPISKIRRSRSTPKGRAVDPVAREEIARLLEGAPRAAEYLIENLHRVQDAFGHLSAANLAALAEAMKLSMAEVYEVATFYHHFDIVREGEQAPAQVTVRVCETLSCRMAGADKLLEKLPGLVGPNVRVIAAPCIGRCAEAPAVCVGHNAFGHASESDITRVLSGKATAAPALQPQRFDEYVAAGGYKTWFECVTSQREVEDVIKVMENAGLRGLGGAGFPSGRKWRIVRAEPGPRLMAVNIDEGEPGTFKDRVYLERDPHRFLEGMLVAAQVVGI
ncbi:MAG: NAD(P)H-dependent oxidoreductase subunit E, partial [Usitatibacter sp.]